MSRITTHVLDTAKGRPAVGIRVTLEAQTDDGGWTTVGRGHTDADGRAADLFNGDTSARTYRLTFETAAYFAILGVNGFFPIVEIVFEIRDPSQHYHVPLLLSPYGYSTYRGS